MLSGRFQAVQVDLGNDDQVGKVTDAVKKSGIPLSVLDLSNVWQDVFPNNYLSWRQTAALFDHFDKVASSSTLIVATAGKARQNPEHKLIKYVVQNFAEVRKQTSGIEEWGGRVRGPEDFARNLEFKFDRPPIDVNGMRCLIVLSK